LELTVQEEMVILENLSTFQKNGFGFEINMESPPTKRIKLASHPYSKKTTFGVQGINFFSFFF